VELSPALFFEYSTVSRNRGDLSRAAWEEFARAPAVQGVAVEVARTESSSAVRQGAVRVSRGDGARRRIGRADERSSRPIAIVGVSGVFRVRRSWQDLGELAAGKESIQEYRKKRWAGARVWGPQQAGDKTNIKWRVHPRRGVIRSAVFQHLSPREAESMDRSSGC